MKINKNEPPRIFEVGFDNKIKISDCGRIELAPDEQVTFITESGSEYDLARKDWGFYATPSLNGRLLRYNLRPVMVKNRLNQFFILLVEKGKEQMFRDYIDSEKLDIVFWMDDTSKLEFILRTLNREKEAADICPLCDKSEFTTCFVYTEPPSGETRFHDASSNAGYYREILRCGVCGHFISRHNMDMKGLYENNYVNSTYGEDGIKTAFERLISLPPDKSDNEGRSRRLLEWASTYLKAPQLEGRCPKVLDVGSGLCVFLYKMKAAGWDCTALDPDMRSTAHARETVGVKSVCGDFMDAKGLEIYDLITFNKVLEHVADPVSMLAKCRDYLNSGGFVYIEVPDGEMAFFDGPSREEFFIDHLHVFSLASLSLLAARAGFILVVLERLKEPSTKYTLRAFLVPGQK